MGFLIREGARLVVRLPQEVDHHKTESIRVQVDQMIRKEPVTEVEFDFSRTMFMDSAGIGLLGMDEIGKLHGAADKKDRKA